MTDLFTTKRCVPWCASAASACLPGLGQLLNGERAKGWSLICIAVGLALSVVLTTSLFSRILFGMVAMCIWLHAVIDAYRTATGHGRTFTGSRRPAVILMLLVVGPFALTLLWTSPHFSRRAKWWWSALVVGIALLFVLTIGPVGAWMDRLLEDLQSTL